MGAGAPVALALLHAQALHQVGGLEHARVDQRLAQMPCPAHHGVGRSHQVPQFIVGAAGLEILAGGGVLRGGVSPWRGAVGGYSPTGYNMQPGGVAGARSRRYRAKS